MWYIIGLIVVGSLVVFGVFTQLYLLSVVTVLFTGVILLIENNSAPTTSVTIREDAIMIDEKTYPMSDYANFQIITTNGYAYSIRFLSKKKLGAPLEIPFVAEVDVDSLRFFLLNIFPEGKMTEMSGMDTLVYASKI